MTDPASLPEIRILTVDPSEVDTELVVVPVFGDSDELSDLSGIDAAVCGEISRARECAEFRTTGSSVFVTPLIGDSWRAGRVALVGVDPAEGELVNQLRTATALAVGEARRRRVERIAVILRGDVLPCPAAQAVTEGVLIGGFENRRYKSSSDDAPPPTSLLEAIIVAGTDHEASARTGVDKGVILGVSCNLARELINEPANILTPTAFANRALAMVGEQGVQVEVLGEDAIRDLGMGFLLGVARGSRELPRLVVMRHTPAEAPIDRVFGFVGKGVTFDTGGISIKPADEMDLMKRDMAGGAAVVGALRAVAALQLPVRVMGIVPMTENMPGGRAIKPGDILTGASGKTVEVLNTDAEGRLILADALWYAQQLGATHLVDVATLTGSCVVALGKVASGLFGQPAEWVERVSAAGQQAGERLWQLPLYKEYREQLRSEMADLSNIGGRSAGACTAATFLRAFVEDVPWAHVDIAGTAWSDDEGSHLVKGATGVMVRTLAELACGSSSY